MWFRRVFFLWWRQYLWGLAVESSQHLNFECTDYMPVCHHWPGLVQRSLSPVPAAQHIQRALQPCLPPKSSLMVFRTRGCRFFLDNLRSCARTQVYRIDLVSVKCHCHKVKAFCGRVGPVSPCTLEIFSGSNDVNHG